MIDTFLRDVTAYCAARGIKPETLGYYAANDTRLFATLESGEQRILKKIRLVRAYMDENPVQQNTPEQTASRNTEANQ